MTDIVRNEGVLGGDPRIEGTRIGVLHVYEFVVEGSCSPEDVADQLDIGLDEVYAALSYYYANPDEMTDVRERHAELDRELAATSLRPPETAE
ncbi:DUF433 domain-containing protein [Halovivax sp.]|uniref:DUF433 domain-containing protein n=1 Tax=Halovivax sp. TaxID=1935978 RepID=UPI0025BC5D52|nr:DUF433 domain-containing protein [Halovivax sp.]